MVTQMSSVWCGILLAVGLAGATQAQNTTQHKPAGATALCRDGSFSKSAQKRGACSRHKGVQTWYGTPSSAQKNHNAQTAALPLLQAPAKQGQPIVWVNLTSRVFHCQGSRWYGKTQRGTSMEQAQALAHNYQPAGGKLCKY